MVHEQLTPRQILCGLGMRRQPRRRASFAPQFLALEERSLMSVAVPIPASNPHVPLSTIFWNGEPTPLGPNGQTNLPSPESVGSAKTITITNTGPSMIYPFLRGQNGGIDPHATPPAPYDPQDLANHEFREYVGFSLPGGKQFLGLPSGASITIQVPLALWDGDNLYLATDGAYLTSDKLFAYNRDAPISIAGTSPVSGSTWLQASSNYPTGVTPLVMFYSSKTPLTLPNDAPAQLTEVTFRDQYLTHFINDPSQTFPLNNYDVSYVNNMVAPVSMEASHVAITYQKNPLPAPPAYYGYKDFGWLATNRGTAAFEGEIANFIHNRGIAGLGQYFGGKGWPQYYNPHSNQYDIPAGGNLFANSPLNKGTGFVNLSSFDPNHWLLTSAGNAPITAGGPGVGVQGFVRGNQTTRIYLNHLPKGFAADLFEMLQQGSVNVIDPSTSAVLTQVTKFVPNLDGIPFVIVKPSISATPPSGSVFSFTRTPTDYAVTDITNLWYSWAQYHVQQYQNFTPESAHATLAFATDKGNTYATNKITLYVRARGPTRPGDDRNRLRLACGDHRPEG